MTLVYGRPRPRSSVSRNIPSTALTIALRQVFFFAAAALALAAFFLLLLIITIPINVPTTAEPNRVRMTGMRIAQTRGGNRSWRGWPGSTNG